MKTKRQKLIDACDYAWSLAVRTRDKRCMLCGGHVGDIKSLQAHHWIVSRGKSTRFRFDLRNGVALCYGCHIHQVHTNPTVQTIENLKSKCLLAGIATKNDIDYIVFQSHNVSKFSIADFENIKKMLESEIKAL